MKLKTAEAIMQASHPSELFTMNVDTLEREYQQYVEYFKPKDYNTIRNFVVTQKVTLLYRNALSILDNTKVNHDDYSITIIPKGGEAETYEYHYSYDIKLGNMYVNENEIIFVIRQQYKKYYENYIDKAINIPKLNKDVWSRTQYSFPKITNHFQAEDGSYVIIVTKPCKIYPLREVLNYFGGKLHHEHVAAILNRLYYFVCYMDIIGLQHNGITIDNLFFAPGRKVKEGESFTVEDMRIVGVFGGWFFTTKIEDELMGMPREVYDSLPARIKAQKYSSFEVDELAIKQVGRELLGDSSGENLTDIPEPIVKWLNNKSIHKNAYEEYCAWEDTVIQAYGKKRFVDMDISI